MVGSRYADTLSGSDVADVLKGAGGNDIINGRYGNDKLYGRGWLRHRPLRRRVRVRRRINLRDQSVNPLTRTRPVTSRVDATPLAVGAQAYRDAAAVGAGSLRASAIPPLADPPGVQTLAHQASEGLLLPGVEEVGMPAVNPAGGQSHVAERAADFPAEVQ